MLIKIFGDLPAEPPIKHIKAGPAHLWSKFHFQWHREHKKVYVVRIPAEKTRENFAACERLVAEPIAHDITSDGAAINAVLLWTRGYMEKEREINLPPHITGVER